MYVSERFQKHCRGVSWSCRGILKKFYRIFREISGAFQRCSRDLRELYRRLRGYPVHGCWIAITGHSRWFQDHSRSFQGFQGQSRGFKGPSKGTPSETLLNHLKLLEMLWNSSGISHKTPLKIPSNPLNRLEMHWYALKTAETSIDPSITNFHTPWNALKPS